MSTHTQGAETEPSDGRPWRLSFWSLILTQFQGAFSDVTLKNLVIFTVMGMGLSHEERDKMVSIVGAVFSLPFILFSMAGGYLADRYSKRTITVGVKLFEMGVMAFASLALFQGSLPLQLAGVFLMGVHSAIFSPSKYGLLPEVLPESRLSWGNGILELGTFLAIIAGTIAGAVLSQWFHGRQVWSGVLLAALAVVGFFTSQGISRVPAANPQKQFRPNFLADLVAQLKSIHTDRPLWLAVIGNAYFFFLAALLQQNVIIYGQDILGLDAAHGGYLQAAIAIGIGVGSVAAGYLSAGKIEYGLIPLGSIGLTGMAAVLGLFPLTFKEVLIGLALLGFFGGFFIVPISALLQHRPAPGEKGGVLAAASFTSWIGVFLASAAYYGASTLLKLSPGGIFFWSSVLTALGTAYLIWLLPDSFFRLLLWMLTHTLYRVRVVGRDNIPEKGGALFVCNHLSFVDVLLLQSSTDRPIRFIMHREIYDQPWIRPVAKLSRAIPISSQLRPREMIASLREASDALQRGEVVCIFAEGQISRIGQLLPFRRGFERIMKGVDAPIIPVCLDGVWGSIFSFESRRFFWKLPRRIPYPVTVSYGRPMPPSATPSEVRQSVQELQTEAAHLRADLRTPVHRAFIRTARRSPFRRALADATHRGLRLGPALVRTLLLARRLAPLCRGQAQVGLLLPPSVGGALTNLALLIGGKVPVNLNYTLSEEALASCIRQCGIQNVITSAAFQEKLKCRVPCALVNLEEVARGISVGERVTALLAAAFLPARSLERWAGADREPTLEDLATIIFSSGSTGEPKGVMLTHQNIGANVEQFGQVFALGATDRILGVLPFFHSFGYTATLALPAMLGTPVVYHPNPLDPRGIGELVRRFQVTFLLSTPTFLQMYHRGCEAGDFGSLRLVLVGAEKLSDAVATAFEEKFGIRPVEAYGCTECSPGVSVSCHSYRAAGFNQVGAKRGKIGHPLPGVSVRIVDPESFQPLEIGRPGLLLVRGPNLMKGYWQKPEATQAVVREGWYITGDIATLDEDGFLQITDRLSRFSKIGGEMVPHVKVEDRLQELAGIAERGLVVTGLPDPRKGERLVVLHTLPEAKLAELLARLPESNLPNLWVPRPSAFIRIEALPHLGTGKLDLRRVRELAAQLSTAGDEPTPAEVG